MTEQPPVGETRQQRNQAYGAAARFAVRLRNRVPARSAAVFPKADGKIRRSIAYQPPSVRMGVNLRGPNGRFFMQQLCQSILSLPAMRLLSEALSKGNTPVAVSGVTAAHKAHVMAAALSQHPGAALIVTADEPDAPAGSAPNPAQPPSATKRAPAKPKKDNEDA